MWRPVLCDFQICAVGTQGPSTATINTWQCLAYIKQAKSHWLFHVLIRLSLPSHDPHKAQILLIYQYGNSSALSTHSAFSCHHKLTSCCFFFFLFLIFFWWQSQSHWTPNRHSLMQSVAPSKEKSSQSVVKGRSKSSLILGNTIRGNTTKK